MNELNRDAWLAQRRTGIGGSDVAPILGLSPWRTPYQVWEDKMGLGEEQEESAALYWGRLLEDPIRQAYADATGRAVVKPSDMYRHPQHPFMLANLDGIADNGNRLVEFKTTSRADGWGEVGTDQIPDYYLTQVQHYMAVMSAPVCDVAVLIAGRDFRIFSVEADKELQDILIEKERAFWDLVEAGTPPDPFTTDDASRKWRNATAKKIVQASAGDVATWTKLQGVRAQMKALEEEEDKLKTSLMATMKDAVSLKHDGKTLVSWSVAKARQTLDTQRIRKEYPDIYDECLKTGVPSRTFRVYA